MNELAAAVLAIEHALAGSARKVHNLEMLLEDESQDAEARRLVETASEQLAEARSSLQDARERIEAVERGEE